MADDGERASPADLLLEGCRRAHQVVLVGLKRVADGQDVNGAPTSREETPVRLRPPAQDRHSRLPLEVVRLPLDRDIVVLGVFDRQ